MPEFVLHDLNARESLVAVWLLLFSPSLRQHFGPEWSLEWTRRLIRAFVVGDHDEFSGLYSRLSADICSIHSPSPSLSMANPPWSMISLDLMVGLIPWVSPLFDKMLLLLFAEGAAMEKHFGEVLPFAFVLSGGPGESRETAIRICAPNAPVRASAEHWLMRAFLSRRDLGLHATLGDDSVRRKFSMHAYTDREGSKGRVFFETTQSFGREKEDFREFLYSNAHHLSNT